MSKVCRKTPVWRNKRTGRVVCGTTVQDALGVGRMCHVGEDWERASSLPPEHRVVINDGSVLPENDISCATVVQAFNLLASVILLVFTYFILVI